MYNKVDLTGKRFGKLVVLKEDGRIDKQRAWICKCDCGNIVRLRGHSLGRNTNSCGCLKAEKIKARCFIHGLSRNPLYNVWRDMKKRCDNEKDINYKNYGKRGIKVCHEWENDFMSFYCWAIENGYSKGLSIDRIDNDGNYSPENCRWIPLKEQNSHKRNNHLLTYKGETMTIAQWARKIGIDKTTLTGRINVSKWSVEKAIETPTRKNKEKKTECK